MKREIAGGLISITIVALYAGSTVPGASAQIQKIAAGVPIFEVDLSWPDPHGRFGTKGNWVFGAISGIAVDPSNGHIWVASRPATVPGDEAFVVHDPAMTDCCVPAPPVSEFDAEGRFIQGWGGPGPGNAWQDGQWLMTQGIYQIDAKGTFILGRPSHGPGFDWWVGEQGISVDSGGNVWLAGSNQVLEFMPAGKLLLQIGHAGKPAANSNDTEDLHRPTKAVVYPKTNEVFVSDDRRVIVFDAKTGAFKRLWGAYGKKPDEAAPRTRVFEGPAPQQFNDLQSIAISNGGLVYVADGENNRIQVFKPDGTFVKEGFVARDGQVPGGTVVDLAFSADPQQQFLYVSGADDHIRILNRDTLQTLGGSIGRLGYYPGQFYHLDAIAVDSKGNLYTGDGNGGDGEGRLVQRLSFERIASASDALRLQEAAVVPNQSMVDVAEVLDPGVAGPIFQTDPFWPKQVGNFGVYGDWLLGAVGGIAVDPKNDHVWVLNRPLSLSKDEKYLLDNPLMMDCCVPTPPVLEFDSAGNFIQGWGGWGPNLWVSEHGIFIDHRGNVWLGNSGGSFIREYTSTGKLLLQIGHPFAFFDSSDTENLGGPTRAVVWPETNEVFVADGYDNRRVIVFDADTGKFKRMWGAYGNKPDADDAAYPNRVFVGPPPLQFTAVHDIGISNDSLVYVCDRQNSRVQVFKLDGTFVKEVLIDRLMGTPSGTASSVAFSADPQQQFLYVAGSDSGYIYILNRKTLQVIGKFGRLGHYPGQTYHQHYIASDSKGNVYVSEAAGDSRRVVKFVFKGISSGTTQ